MAGAPSRARSSARTVPAIRGLRRESLVLLPTTLLLFAALAFVTLLLYRSAIQRLVTERQTALLRQAISLAEAARGEEPAALSPFSRFLPPATHVALLDSSGAVSWEAGVVDPGRSPEFGSSSRPVGEASVRGPGGELGDRIVAVAPVPVSPAEAVGGRRYLRLTSPEPGLAAELDRLRVLGPVVVGGSVGVAILAVVFLYALNRPVALLLERAREIAPGDGEPSRTDEVDLLLSAFDRALAALRASDSDPSGNARRAAEERLAETVSQLGELSAGVAHELRNSLGTLQGYLSLLARRELPREAREEVEDARREAVALGCVVDDFLAFARPGVRVLEAIDLAATVRRALSDPSLADCPMSSSGLDCTWLIRGDSGLLTRALRNLLLNATQAQKRGGATAPVEVSITAAAGAARLRIRDHGPGIDPGVAPRLFAPFATGRPDGAGLGLALARRIVLIHGGRLELHDHPEGGAVAEVVLPLDQFVT